MGVIYKITNKTNGKAYIGQSINYKKRWQRHRSGAFLEYSDVYEYPISRAFRKYGLDNFTFEIIERCENSDMNDKEIYWIKYFDTFHCGYNQTLGGSSASSKKSESVKKVLFDLEHTDLTHGEIAKRHNISTEMVQGINTGRYWHENDRTYPIQKRTLRIKSLRPVRKKLFLGAKRCVDCNKIIKREATRCSECYNIAQRKVERPSKEELLSLILSTSMLQIARNYGVSDNAVRKWCKNYGLPYRREDILNYGKTEEEIEQKRLKRQKPKRDKPVAQLDIGTDEVLGQYSSIAEAGRALGILDPAHISAVCLGKRKTAYGFSWRYLEE